MLVERGLLLGMPAEGVLRLGLELLCHLHCGYVDNSSKVSLYDSL